MTLHRSGRGVFVCGGVGFFHGLSPSRPVGELFSSGRTMRIVTIICGLLSLGCAVLLAIPVIGLVWNGFISTRSSSQTGSLPRSQSHTDFILSIGGWTVSGWQMWLVVAGLGTLALLLF